MESRAARRKSKPGNGGWIVVLVVVLLALVIGLTAAVINSLNTQHSLECTMANTKGPGGLPELVGTVNC